MFSLQVQGAFCCPKGPIAPCLLQNNEGHFQSTTNGLYHFYQTKIKAQQVVIFLIDNKGKMFFIEDLQVDLLKEDKGRRSSSISHQEKVGIVLYRSLSRSLKGR